MTGGFYILDEERRVVEADYDTWAFWIQARRETGHYHIAKTQIKDGPWVSTIFVGIAHGLGFDRPLLFETAVFRAPCPGADPPLAVGRASTIDEALAQHEEMVERFGHQIGEQMRREHDREADGGP